MRKLLVSFILLTLTVVVYINHLGTVLPLKISPHEAQGPAGVLIEKTPNSHRHVILQGPDYHRGSEFGRLTQAQLLKQENLLISKLDGFIGNALIQNAFFTAAMVWFHDADEYIDQASYKEMQGVGAWAPKKYDYLASGFTRQIAYHGLHEVGQMFVDEDRVDMGCFASAIQTDSKQWIIGRNFDFDVDGLFDREKMLKWVFPDQGIPYVSIIWGGMVGAVTGVNQNGLFVAINAAGSDDFARVGTPTTVIVKNILSTAHTLEEAISLLEKSSVFITDIFILADKKTNQVAVVEKSPKRIDVKMLSQTTVVANHLIGEIWKNDETNENRKTNLTSDFRYRRGQELITGPIPDPLTKTVEILRDKKLFNQQKAHLGHRGAIDSLIASQSVIYQMEQGILYVNLGPGTQGKYLGYDIQKSFEQKRPILAGEIAQDSISAAEYARWQQMMTAVETAKVELKQGKCSEVEQRLLQFKDENFIHYNKERVMGDYAEVCLNDLTLARTHWQAALDLFPPYANQRNYLQEKLK